MKSLFEVNGKNKFENNKKMVVSVYGVRTSRESEHKAEFLVYYANEWIWMNASNYTPINNKHS